LVKNKRIITQLFSTLLANSYVKGFLDGTIYNGSLKKICFPGLNCYSCPGALGACPLGSLQSVAAGIKFQVSLYVIGFLMLIGTLTGRLVCGYLCPFGFFQELLYKIPSKKITIPKWLSYMKYVFLVLFVILLPALLTNEYGFGTQYFCKYICPAGTLEAGIPHALLNGAIRESLGWLFSWKLLILAGTIMLAVVSKRPFCRTVCPLGAIYSLFNPISFFKLKVDNHSCSKCGKCKSKCPVDISIYENPNSMECVRCGECKKTCPQNAIRR
jgi:polyferredoxin